MPQPQINPVRGSDFEIHIEPFAGGAAVNRSDWITEFSHTRNDTTDDGAAISHGHERPFILYTGDACDFSVRTIPEAIKEFMKIEFAADRNTYLQVIWYPLGSGAQGSGMPYVDTVMLFTSFGNSYARATQTGKTLSGMVYDDPDYGEL